jgi:hypothetical protein
MEWIVAFCLLSYRSLIVLFFLELTTLFLFSCLINCKELQSGVVCHSGQFVIVCVIQEFYQVIPALMASSYFLRSSAKYYHRFNTEFPVSPSDHSEFQLIQRICFLLLNCLKKSFEFGSAWLQLKVFNCIWSKFQARVWLKQFLSHRGRCLAWQPKSQYFSCSLEDSCLTVTQAVVL